MKPRYPNKQKRAGFWKKYERANIKDYSKVWGMSLALAQEQKTPFEPLKRGRKPNLNPEECVSMAILYAYFNLDFREIEELVFLLSGKHLDHSNCVRWFGRLNEEYVNNLVFAVHKKIIEIDDAGDYIVDSTKATCDTLEIKEVAGEEEYRHTTWKLHLLAQYIFTLGVISIVVFFSSPGEVNDSPPLRNNLLQKDKVKAGKKVHGDKGYFGKENIKKCKELELIPNIVPQEKDYSDGYLKRYIRTVYDNEARKKNRGLIEGIFGGIQTETDVKVRCRKPKHRNLFLGLTALKHNIRTYFRATALNLIYAISHQPYAGRQIYK